MNERNGQRPPAGRAAQNRRPKANGRQRQDEARRTANGGQRRSETRTRRPAKPVSRGKLRFKRFILSFCAISAVILIGVYLSLTVWFKAENIRVVGETRYSSEQIIGLCTIKEGENIFLADKTKAAETIKAGLPYIASVDVGFSIPDTITIKVTEAQAAYQAGLSNGEFADVSAEGRILRKTAKKEQGIPLLECSGLKNTDEGAYIEFEDESTVEILTSIVKELETLSIDKITVIDITNTAKIKLFYDDRILIVIGLPEDINYKLRTAITIISDKLDPNNSGVITGRLDVSVCNTTKKSYFNNNEVYTPPSQVKKPAATEPTSQTEPTSPTEPPDSTDYSGGDYSGDDYSGDDYSGDDYSGGDYSGDDYSGDDYSGGDYSGDDYSGQ